MTRAQQLIGRLDEYSNNQEANYWAKKSTPEQKAVRSANARQRLDREGGSASVNDKKKN